MYFGEQSYLVHEPKFEIYLDFENILLTFCFTCQLKTVFFFFFFFFLEKLTWL